MSDIKRLTANIASLKEFLDLWVKFFDFVVGGRKMESVGTKDEAEFLGVKSSLARKRTVLEAALMGDAKLDPNINNIVSQATSLDSMKALSEVAIKKFENEWHRAYLNINEALGMLESKRDQAAKETSFSKLGKSFSGSKTGVLAIVIIIVLVGAGIFVYKTQPDLVKKIIDSYKSAIGMR